MKKNTSKILLDLLDKERKEALFLLSPFFKQKGILCGGTALMVQLGHRRSYDFDIFFPSQIPEKFLRKASKIFGPEIRLETDNPDELTFITSNKIKISFVYFPFPRLYPTLKIKSVSLSVWQDIASDKAYTIGRRPQYRDYIDLYFILKKGFPLPKIIEDAKKKYRGEFSEKLFFGQLSYLEDIRDFKIDFLKEKVTKKQVQKFFEKEVKKLKLLKGR
ncbi:MAG: hypothetical protein COS47_00930 [Candidatus Nealsonbacteria bacterium CG03_land_8_20_14_0_80_36_12]|uniref:Nucleotidyl transferase AbiEii/AbiGii toxin family protein n=1 Tax=Candidatus Nealsonbacteria bacterium CG03_land_8_20_14_0_80_36_12 TaxID=1974701 RepID=A0A2M7BYM5_9BACT|nr:MAG: hypothetical protein COS47_00930 [Candidatus Nealsonbacteria bacterium CG03_land_8_20_14_0_80_36_12]